MAKSAKNIVFNLLIIQLFFLIIFSGCGPGLKNIRLKEEDINQIKRLAIIIPPEPEFTIIHDRAMSKGAPIPIIPTAIIWTYRETQDKKREQLISPKLGNFSCRSIFLQTLHNALANAGRFSEIRIFDHEYEKKTEYKSDATLLFRIQKCGLQSIIGLRSIDWPNDRVIDFMTTFMEYEIKLIELKKNSVLWEDDELVIGQGRNSFETYQKDIDHLKNELQKTVEEVALRIADILIYQ